MPNSPSRAVDTGKAADEVRHAVDVFNAKGRPVHVARLAATAALIRRIRRDGDVAVFGQVLGVQACHLFVIDDDRYAGQLLELCQRHRLGCQRSGRAGHGRRQFALREDEAAAGLEGHDRLDIGVLDRRQPARAAALRMGEQDGRPDLAEQRSHRIRNHAGVVRAGVGRDRADELVQRLRFAIELHVVEIGWPLPQAELVKEQLVVGGLRNRCGDGAVAGFNACLRVDIYDRKRLTCSDVSA